MAWWNVGVGAAGVISGVIGGRKSRKQQAKLQREAQAQQWQIMQQELGLAQETMAFQKQAYADQQARQGKLDHMQERISSDYLEDSRIARERGKEAYNLYQQHGKQVQEKALQEAMTHDSQENVALHRGRAGADVAQSFGQAEGQMTRNLSRMGVMPNASRLASINAGLAAQKAAAQAGAMNNAELGVRNQAMGMRANASNLASALAGQAQNMSNSALGFGQGAFGNAMGANQASMAAKAQALSGLTAASGMYGNAGLTAARWGSQALDYAKMAQQDQQNYGQMAAWGIGKLANANWSSLGGGGGSTGGATTTAPVNTGGWVSPEGGSGYQTVPMADGGLVRGPGNGTSDSVPAALSDGEYVIPADTVRKMGTEYFDKLVARTHTPAALQRKGGK